MFTRKKNNVNQIKAVEDVMHRIYEYSLNGFATVKRIANTCDEAQKVDVILEVEDGGAFRYTFIDSKTTGTHLYGAMYMNETYEEIAQIEYDRALNGSVVAIVPLPGENVIKATGVRKLRSYQPYM